MPSIYYKRDFQKDGCYHITNKGAVDTEIFRDDEDYFTFLSALRYYILNPDGKPQSVVGTKKKDTKYSKIDSSFNLIAFSLLPNRFNFLFHQVADSKPENSIENLMKRLSITYSMHYKKKHKFNGTLFQGKYKNIKVEEDSDILLVCKYIHRRPLTTKLVTDINQYQYTSHPFYAGTVPPPSWFDTIHINKLFKTTNHNSNYLEFLENPTILPTDSPLKLE